MKTAKKNNSVKSKMKTHPPVRSVKNMPEYKDKHFRESVLFFKIFLILLIAFLVWYCLTNCVVAMPANVPRTRLFLPIL